MSEAGKSTLLKRPASHPKHFLYIQLQPIWRRYKKGIKSISILLLLAAIVIVCVFFRYWFSVAARTWASCESLTGSSLITVTAPVVFTIICWVIQCALVGHKSALKDGRKKIAGVVQKIKQFGFIACGVGVVIFVFYTFLIAPPLIHETKTSELRGAAQLNQSLSNKIEELFKAINVLSNRETFLQARVDYVENSAATGPNDYNDPKNYRSYAAQAFYSSSWETCVGFSELALQETRNGWPDNYQKVMVEPFYFFAILKTNTTRLGITPQEKRQAFNAFEVRLASMTNKISKAVGGKYPADAYNLKDYLGYNIDSLKSVVNLIEDEETNYVSTIIETIIVLRNNAANQ